MAAPRKPKVEMYWSMERKTKDELAAERAAAKFRAAYTGDEVEHVIVTRDVINWRLVGANGEVMCQCTQGFTSRQSALESINRCGVLLANAGCTGPKEAKITGPGRKPL